MSRLREKVVKEIGAAFADLYDEIWDSLGRETESPIEHALIVAFSGLCHRYGESAYVQPPSSPTDWLSILPSSQPRDPWIVVEPQKKLRDYRVDFLVSFNVGLPEPDKPVIKTVVVECDGHDFHDRTPEQASRDRARDRAIQASGIPVLRFTGTDINRNPMKCAESIFEYIDITRSDTYVAWVDALRARSEP